MSRISHAAVTPQNSPRITGHSRDGTGTARYRTTA